MAVETDTATDYLDLLARIGTFADAQGWDVLHSSATELVLRGPELASYARPHIAIDALESVGADWYNLRIRGLHDWDSGLPIGSQPLVSQSVWLQLWDSSIPYRLVVSDRRIIVAAQVSTVYQAGYAGLILPYAAPSEWPYPMLVAACHANTANGVRWSDTSTTHRMPWHSRSGARLWTPNGAWTAIDHGAAETTNVASLAPSRNGYGWQRPSSGGDSPLTPLTVYQTTDGLRNTYGILDGLYALGGTAVSAGSTVEIDSVDYLALPDVYRSGAGDFGAVRLS